VRGKYAQALPEHQVHVGPAARTRLEETGLKQLVEDLTKLVGGLDIVKSGDNLIQIKTRSGELLTIQSVEQITPDRIALNLGYSRASAKGRSIAGAYFGVRPQKETGSVRPGVVHLVRDKAGIWTLTHEFYHFLEDIGVISNADKVLLNNKIAALIAKDPQQYGRLKGRSNAEARAEWVGRTLAGMYDAKTPTGKILQK